MGRSEAVQRVDPMPAVRAGEGPGFSGQDSCAGPRPSITLEENGRRHPPPGRRRGGDPQAAADLLPLVYDELRRLAAARMAGQAAGHTLQPTALVHEAYLRLVGRPTARGGTAGATSSPPRPRPCGASWSIGPAAGTPSSGAGRPPGSTSPRRPGRPRRRGDAELLALDEALDRLAAADPQAAELVKLRYFAGLTIPEAAAALGISPRTADRLWAYARAWLRAAIGEP